MTATAASAMMIATTANPSGRMSGDDGAEEQQQDDERNGDAEPLSLLKVVPRQLVVLEGYAGVSSYEHAKVVRRVCFFDNVDDVFDVCRGFLGRASQGVVHHDGPLAGGDQQGEQLLQLFLGDGGTGVQDLVVVGHGRVVYSAGDSLRSQGGDSPVDCLHLGAKDVVLNGQGRRLDDNDLGKQLGSPQLLLEQGVCALGLVPAGQPEVGGCGAGEELRYEGGGNSQEHHPYADDYPGPLRADTGQ